MDELFSEDAPSALDAFRGMRANLETAFID